MSKTIHNQTSALQEIPGFLNNIVNNLPGMVYRCRNNRSWTMEYVSSGSESLTGYTHDGLVFDNARTFASLIVEEDRDRVLQQIQKAIKQNQRYKTVYRIITKQRDQKWVWEQGHASYSTEDDVSVLEGIIIDITEQKTAESALQESKNHFRNIVDGSIEGICIHSDWRPLFANQAMADMLGYDSPAEILALTSISDLVAPLDRDRLLRYRQAREMGEAAPRRYEFEALRRDGTPVCLENVVTRVDWDGQAAVLCTYVDVTERNRALREAEQQRQQLAHIDRLNTLGEMAAGIAHEINQPLTAIVSRCGAARRRIDGDDPDLDKLRTALKVITQQAHRSGEIVQRMRELAKRRNEQCEIIEIDALVQHCIEFAKMDGHMWDVRTHVDLQGNLPPVIGDPIQIQQVILNLIRNATDVMEHLPVAERRLTISVKRHDDSAVQVSVADCGSGISAETEANLFQPFFTTKELGMGMGLSICRSIVLAHGGQFWFTRNPELGITFRFTLPMALGGDSD